MLLFFLISYGHLRWDYSCPFACKIKKKISNAKAIVNFFREMTTESGISGELQTKSKILYTLHRCRLMHWRSSTYKGVELMKSGTLEGSNALSLSMIFPKFAPRLGVSGWRTSPLRSYFLLLVAVLWPVCGLFASCLRVLEHPYPHLPYPILPKITNYDAWCGLRVHFSHQGAKIENTCCPETVKKSEQGADFGNILFETRLFITVERRFEPRKRYKTPNFVPEVRTKNTK